MDVGLRVPVGRRNLFGERRRGVLGVAATAAALLLVLAVGAVFDGAMARITRYIDAQPAQVFVSQPGVRNFHMSASSVPLSASSTISSVPGVRSVAPILFTQDGLSSPSGRRLAYVFGYRSGAAGGPDRMVEGSGPGPGEMVLDDATAASLGVSVGGRVESLGTSWRVSGLAGDLSNITTGTAFVRFEDFSTLRDLSETASYLLVTTEGDPDGIARAIERRTGLEATTREAFAGSERALVSDMIGEVLRLVTTAAWLVGLAVVALTLYSATWSRLREIGVMKALGAGRAALARTVLAQAAWSVGAALVVATAITLVLGWVLSRTSSPIAITLQPASLMRAAAVSAAVGAVAAVAPLVKVARLDPASVFRR